MIKLSKSIYQLSPFILTVVYSISMDRIPLNIIKQLLNHHFPMVFLWKSHGFTRKLPWNTTIKPPLHHHLPMGFSYTRLQEMPLLRLRPNQISYVAVTRTFMDFSGQTLVVLFKLLNMGSKQQTWGYSGISTYDIILSYVLKHGDLKKQTYLINNYPKDVDLRCEWKSIINQHGQCGVRCKNMARCKWLWSNYSVIQLSTVNWVQFRWGIVE